MKQYPSRSTTLRKYLNRLGRDKFIHSLDKLHFFVVDGKGRKIISFVRNRRYPYRLAFLKLIILFASRVCHNDFATLIILMAVLIVLIVLLAVLATIFILGVKRRGESVALPSSVTVVADFDNTLGCVVLKDQEGMEKALFKPNEVVKVEVKAHEGYILSNIRVVWFISIASKALFINAVISSVPPYNCDYYYCREY